MSGRCPVFGGDLGSFEVLLHGPAEPQRALQRGLVGAQTTDDLHQGHHRHRVPRATPKGRSSRCVRQVAGTHGYKLWLSTVTRIASKQLVGALSHYSIGCGLKKTVPTWLAWYKWKHGPNPAVCPSCLILSHRLSPSPFSLS